MFNRRAIRHKRAFTLVEVLLAILILSCGIVFIFRAFFTLLGAIDEVTDRLNLLYVLHDKILDVKLAVEGGRPIPSNKLNGSVEIDKKPFRYDINVRRFFERPDLRKIDIAVYWFKGSRKISVSRELLCFGGLE